MDRPARGRRNRRKPLPGGRTRAGCAKSAAVADRPWPRTPTLFPKGPDAGRRRRRCGGPGFRLRVGPLPRTIGGRRSARTRPGAASSSAASSSGAASSGVVREPRGAATGAPPVPPGSGGPAGRAPAAGSEAREARAGGFVLSGRREAGKSAPSGRARAGPPVETSTDSSSERWPGSPPRPSSRPAIRRPFARRGSGDGPFPVGGGHTRGRAERTGGRVRFREGGKPPPLPESRGAPLRRAAAGRRRQRCGRRRRWSVRRWR